MNLDDILADLDKRVEAINSDINSDSKAPEKEKSDLDKYRETGEKIYLKNHVMTITYSNIDKKQALLENVNGRPLLYEIIENKVFMSSLLSKVILENEELFIDVVSKQIKTRKESILEFEKGNRQDLIDKTNEEINILSVYMPEMLSEEEITNIVNLAISEANATSVKDMGSVMRIVSPKVKGKADMSLVSAIIKNKLN